LSTRTCRVGTYATRDASATQEPFYLIAHRTSVGVGVCAARSPRSPPRRPPCTRTRRSRLHQRWTWRRQRGRCGHGSSSPGQSRCRCAHARTCAGAFVCACV